MEQIENESSVWDNIWEGNTSIDFESIQNSLATTKRSKIWLEFTEIINSYLGGWKNVNAIEIGSGMGWYSFVSATEGAQITLLDYSEPALKLAKERLNLFSIKANYIYGNAFDLIKQNDKKYNLSWSFGTAEHFKSDLRQKFFQLHFDYIIDGGVAIISCPHKYALNYRLWMYYANKYNKWNYGLEIPYSKKEFLLRLETSQNKLIKILFDEGRPCINKLMKILKKNSKLIYLLFYLPVKLNEKLKLKIPPFYYRSIILLAKKTN